jgi:hypothetical protein
MLSTGSKAEVRAQVRPAPFVFSHDALVIRGEEASYPDFEVGKSGPVFPIALGHLLWPDEGFRHAANVVEAVGRHALQERFHVVRAFRLNMLAKHGETFLRYPHLGILPGRWMVIGRELDA